MLAWLPAAWLLASLTACGFQLRGSEALPAEMAVTYIQGVSPYSSLVDDFAAALRVRNASVTRQRSEATAVLRIHDSEVEKRVLSVDSAGRVLEYELRQMLHFSVATAAGQLLLEAQPVTLGRDYIYSNTDILGKEREDLEVRKTLQRNLVNMAILRIMAAQR